MIKKFLFKTSLYVLIVFTVSALSIFFMSKSYFKNRVPIIKFSISSEFTKKGEYSNVILGSSHAFYGLNSNVFGSNWINMASPSQSLMEDFEIIRSLSGKTKIKHVVLPFSFFSNYYCLYNTKIGGEKLRIYDYREVYNITYYNQFSINELVSLSSTIIREYFFWADKDGFDFRGNLNEVCQRKQIQITDAELAYKRHCVDSSFEKINPYLDSIISYCNVNNIRLSLVVLPFTKKYRDKIANTSFNSILQRINKKYSVEFIDCRSLVRYKEERFMFRDADHLSPCGRTFLSKYVSKRLGELQAH